MNVLVQPSVSVSAAGLATETTVGCDPDSITSACPTGRFGVPLQPGQTVTIVSNARPPVTLSVAETHLHGVSDGVSIGQCLAYSVMSAADQGSTGIASVHCGMRLPVNFYDSKLTAVSPVTVELQLSAGYGIEAMQLAQSLQMACTSYSRQATGARPTGDCIGSFTAISPTSPGADRVSTLRFQSANGTQPDPLTRIIQWSDYVASAYPANELSWQTGELLAPKEVLIVGADTRTAVPGDYSFNNEECEHDRFFVVSLNNLPGYNPNTVDVIRSSLTVKVEDDDFYGHVQLAAVSQATGLITALSALPPAAASVTIPKVDWNSEVANQPFSVYLARSRLPSESDTAFKQAVGLKPMVVWIKSDFVGMNVNEYDITVTQVTSTGIVVGAAYHLSPSDIYTGDGVTNGMIRVSIASVPANATGALVAPVAVQWYRISVNAISAPASCNEGAAKVIKFNLQKALYSTAAGAYLSGRAISCGMDTTRNPLSSAEATIVFTQTLTIIPEDPRTLNPFRVDLAGFDPSDSVGAEGTKDQPIRWNAGLDGSYVTLSETEHSQCAASGTGFACQPRAFRLHLCATLRDADVATPWSSWGAKRSSFFLQLQDSANTWSQIAGMYNLMCPSAVELDAMSAAVAGTTIECASMSSIERVMPTGNRAVYCEGSEYNALSPSDRYSYCGDHIPKRLMWTMATTANSGRQAFACPSSATASISGANNPWRKLPYVTFVTKSDGGIVNLSRRPSLCLRNGALPTSLVDGAYTDTCMPMGQVSCINLQELDDANFAQNNALLDATSLLQESVFDEPSWDSVTGRLQLNVADRYFDAPQHKTLVNFAIGGCEPEIEADPTSSMNLAAFWEAHEGSSITDPVTSGTTAFGTCDLLTAAHFPSHTGNAAMFAALFGAGSAQPTRLQTEVLAANNKLFGFDSSDIAGANTLFTSPRDIGAAGQWTVRRTTVSNYNDTAIGTTGFAAQLSITLERLQACRDRIGNPVVTAGLQNGQTVYRFKLSSTHVRPTRDGDVSFVHYSPVCSEREYVLAVSNTIYALSGMQTNTLNNAIYVDTVAYAGPPQGVCTHYSECVSTLGARHRCPASPNEYDINTLKAMTYTVNLDMRTVANTVGSTQVTSFYGLADPTQVQVPASNCYGAHIVGVDALSGTGAYSESGISRTRLTFRTACQELRTYGSNTFGSPVADAFATCIASEKAAADFSFTVRVWECTNERSLSSPASPTSGCQLLPDPLSVHIAIAFTLDPVDVAYEIQYDKLMQFYRSVDHRLPDQSFPTTAQAIETWRQKNVLKATPTEPYVTYPVDAMLSASIGFTSGSSIEAVMTTAIRRVRLCKFKEFCHIVGVAPPSPGSPQCTWNSMMIAMTHSPMSNWARNPTLDGNKGCAEVGSSLSCAPVLQQTGVALPTLSCDSLLWENFAVAEAQAYLAHSSALASMMTQIVGASGNVFSTASLAMALHPVLESTIVVDHGATTALAESIYGNCEKNSVSTGPETVIDSAERPTGVTVTHRFPAAPATGETGVCTCKGQRAYAFSADNGVTFPFRPPGERRVIYDNQYYSNNVNAASNLHTCTWRSSPDHADTNAPLNSVDQFTMSLGMLQRNQEYFFEIAAVQYDHQSFTDALLADPLAPDQFVTQSRRLLATDTHTKLHAKQPVVPRAGVLSMPTGAGRRTLAVLMPVSNTLTAHALMPQGAVSLTQASSGGAFTSAAAAGFVVVDGDSVAAEPTPTRNPPVSLASTVDFVKDAYTVAGLSMPFTDYVDVRATTSGTQFGSTTASVIFSTTTKVGGLSDALLRLSSTTNAGKIVTEAVHATSAPYSVLGHVATGMGGSKMDRKQVGGWFIIVLIGLVTSFLDVIVGGFLSAACIAGFICMLEFCITKYSGGNRNYVKYTDHWAKRIVIRMAIAVLSFMGVGFFVIFNPIGVLVWGMACFVYFRDKAKEESHSDILFYATVPAAINFVYFMALTFHSKCYTTNRPEGKQANAQEARRLITANSFVV